MMLSPSPCITLFHFLPLLSEIKGLLDFQKSLPPLLMCVCVDGGNLWHMLCVTEERDYEI